MARTRLRDARSLEAERAYYAQVYPRGYKHDRWPDHVERVAASAALLERWSGRFTSAADLSCGDGALLKALLGIRTIHLGDMNGPEPSLPGRPFFWYPGGALPDSLDQLPEPVDLYVCSETLEHMDDPEALLAELCEHARYLFLSTPVEETAVTGNLEHYWSWGTADIALLLHDCGWTPLEMEVLVPETTRHLDTPYRYQLWLAVNP